MSEIDVLRRNLSRTEEILGLKKVALSNFIKKNKELKEEIFQLKTKNNLVEVPQFVADWFEENKDNLDFRIWEYIKYWDGQEKDDFYNFMDKNDSIETLIRMKIEGYTVKKEQLYVLKNKNTGNILYRQPMEAGNNLLEVIATVYEERTRFTQAEIDKLHTGSYEQIEVKFKEVNYD